MLQLTVDDVGEADGVPVLHVRPDAEGGKRVKTAAGRRVVPIHPELVKIAFLEFVERQREAGEKRLFPEITAAEGRYLSDPFQKWFGRFLERAGAAAPRTSFHSFRHCFRDALGEAGVPGDRIDALCGWVRPGMRDVYGSGPRPATPAKEVAKVRYDSLDLSHLYP